MFVNEIAVSAFSFRGRCNYRPSSVYFILFVLFPLFFLFLFAYLRFGSHFRSHDSHVTGEHMVEPGPIFVVVFLQEQTVLQRTRTRTRTLYI